MPSTRPPRPGHSRSLSLAPIHSFGSSPHPVVSRLAVRRSPCAQPRPTPSKVSGATCNARGATFEGRPFPASASTCSELADCCEGVGRARVRRSRVCATIMSRNPLMIILTPSFPPPQVVNGSNERNGWWWSGPRGRRRRQGGGLRQQQAHHLRGCGGPAGRQRRAALWLRYW